jgi:hypothetical protein
MLGVGNPISIFQSIYWNIEILRLFLILNIDIEAEKIHIKFQYFILEIYVKNDELTHLTKYSTNSSFHVPCRYTNIVSKIRLHYCIEVLLSEPNINVFQPIAEKLFFDFSIISDKKSTYCIKYVQTFFHIYFKQFLVVTASIFWFY